MSENYGRCLCGSVRYRVMGPLRPVVYWHCTMCRRVTGHLVAATACAVSNLTIQSSEHLRWYQSSADARRGFCDSCGSNLFWQPTDGSRICIMAGTLDMPTGLTAVAHIFVADKGDYYALDEHLPRHIDGEHGVATPVPGGTSSPA
jgi:hypothetical protein